MIDDLKRYPKTRASGVEWLGKVPEHWEVRTLRQCAAVAGGMTPSMDNRGFWDGRIPWVTPKDMKRPLIHDSSVRVSTAALRETSLRLIHPPAILIVVRGMILARRVPIAVTSAAVTINQDMKAMIPGPSVDARFLALCLEAAQGAFVPMIDEAGHGPRRLPTERWRRLPVALPSKDEQGRIVRFLNHADRQIQRYIRAKQELIKLLEEQKQGIIHRAVTRGLGSITSLSGMSESERGRDPQISRRQANIPWLTCTPDHWEIVPSRRLFSVRTELARTRDVQLSATQAYGVIPQSEFEERIGRRVVKVVLHLEKRRHVERELLSIVVD